MASLRWIPGLCALFGVTLMGADQPKFETASVKLAEGCSFQNSVNAGMIALNGDPLKVVLREAFQVRIDRIIGPSWLDADCFQITGKVPNGATRDQIPAMLQALLVERFRLAAHVEKRLRAGYALIADKNGPRLKQSDPASAEASAGRVMFGSSAGVAGIKGAISMTFLARNLSGRLNAPVEDLTGLKGKYDVDLWWVPTRDLEQIGSFAQTSAPGRPADDAATPVPNAPTVDIFTAIRSLGLRLEPRKQQVEFLIIDHIERTPDRKLTASPAAAEPPARAAPVATIEGPMPT
jgi:uncharacterized protein (TIGR03435 family)